MFWKYNSLAVSHLDTLLDKQDVTLAEILDQEDIIQECKNQNKKLVEYLTKQEILAELLDLILQEPPEDLEERFRFKLPNIASEVITCDVPQINEKLSSDSTLLDKMYAFLEGPPPLNPLLTSFFSKAFGVLITRRPEQNWYSYQYTCLQVIEYIKAKEGFVGLLLTHIATSAVMDLLLRLITCVEGTENKQNVLTWLNDQQLIERTVALLAPPSVADRGGGGEEGAAPPDGGEEGAPAAAPALASASEAHDNAGQLLVEIIRVSRDAQISATPTEKFHNPLLASAESPEMVRRLLDHMLAPGPLHGAAPGPPLESTIVNGLEVVMALLEVRRPAPQGTGFYQYTAPEDQAPPLAELARQQAVVEATADCLAPRLPALTALLLAPPPRPALPTTAGLLDPPLGRPRLALARLVSALLATNHAPLNLAIAQANTVAILLDLFFKYSLNNFLHCQVESCVHSIIFWRGKAVEEETEGKTESSSLETPTVPLEGAEEGPEHPLEGRTAENPALVQLLTTGRLLGRLVAAWTEPAPPHVSYMGHVTRISNHLAAGLAGPDAPNQTLLLQLVGRLPEETQTAWAAVVAGRLAETNAANELKPTEGHDKRNLSSDDEDSDFRDIQFPQDSALQQMQEMSDNFIESFGFQDDEFSESDENVSRGMRKLNSVNFLMQTDDSTKQAIFDSVCEQRIQAFSSPPPGEAEGEDPWADRTAEITFGAGAARPVEEVADKEDNIAEANDSSDEENEQAPDKMEVDNDQDPWETVEGPPGPVAMDTSSPWGAEPGAPAPAPPAAPAEEGTGWADFGAFTSGGGEGMAGLLPSTLQPQRPEGEGWSPACASSPEATMLDRSDRQEGGALPEQLEERLAEEGDGELEEAMVEVRQLVETVVTEAGPEEEMVVAEVKLEVVPVVAGVKVEEVKVKVEEKVKVDETMAVKVEEEEAMVVKEEEEAIVVKVEEVAMAGGAVQKTGEVVGPGPVAPVVEEEVEGGGGGEQAGDTAETKTGTMTSDRTSMSRTEDGGTAAEPLPDGEEPAETP